MAVANDQIAEVYNVIKDACGNRTLETLRRLTATQAFAHNESYAQTIAALLKYDEVERAANAAEQPKSLAVAWSTSDLPALFDELFIKIGDELQERVQYMIDQGYPRVTIAWRNILDREKNPDGKTGFFRVVGSQHQSFYVSEDLQHKKHEPQKTAS